MAPSLPTPEGLDESYPMWVFPVDQLLELQAWKPHQTMLAEARLVQYKDVPKDSKIIFISHRERHDASNACNHTSLPSLLTTSVRLSMHAYRRYVMAEWTSWTEPDPSGLQFEVMKGAVRAVASTYEWPLENVLIWCDYVWRTPENVELCLSRFCFVSSYASDHVQPSSRGAVLHSTGLRRAAKVGHSHAHRVCIPRERLRRRCAAMPSA